MQNHTFVENWKCIWWSSINITYCMLMTIYHLIKNFHIFPLFKVMTWCLKNILQHGHKSARREASWIFYCIFWCFSCLFLLVSSSCFCNLEVGCFPQLLLLHFYCWSSIAAPKRKAISSVLFPSCEEGEEAKSLTHSSLQETLDIFVCWWLTLEMELPVQGVKTSLWQAHAI